MVFFFFFFGLFYGSDFDTFIFIKSLDCKLCGKKIRKRNETRNDFRIFAFDRYIKGCCYLGMVIIFVCIYKKPLW